MAELKFNKVHKNGWLSYKTPGVAGAVFIDKRMVTPEFLANPPATLDLAIEGLLPPGVNASEAAQAKAAARAERDTKKAERAKLSAEKAQARLDKLNALATKAAEKAAAVAAKVSAPASTEAAQ